MNNKKTNIGGKKGRSGAWSESKWTNQNRFDVFDLEIDRAVDRYRREIERTDRLAIVVEHPHPDFISPVKKHHIIETIRSIPEDFTRGVKSIIVLRGTRRQAAQNSGQVYGLYWENMIFLYPYPKSLLNMTYAKAPRPHILNDHKRAGAIVGSANGSTTIKYTEEAVKQFYLRDVLIHEIGHHVDAVNFSDKSHKKIEGFAEWFATEYGFKKTGDRRT